MYDEFLNWCEYAHDIKLTDPQKIFAKNIFNNPDIHPMLLNYPSSVLSGRNFTIGLVEDFRKNE